MSVPPEVRQQVRERAAHACEYCGVTETDVGGELTIDHYQPRSKGGADDLSNLVYACTRCNQYKGEYWSETSSDEALWNPRTDLQSRHFLEMEDGELKGLSNVGTFSIMLLRLNRPPLVHHRRRRQQQADYERLLRLYRELIDLISHVSEQYLTLIDDQRELFKLQESLLQLLVESHE